MNWAEALLASGAVAQADDVLRTLELELGHHTAAEARRQRALARRPSLGLTTESHDANGYDGARLLATRRERVTSAWTAGTVSSVAVAVDRVRVSGSDEIREGPGAGLSAAFTPWRTIRVGGDVSVWDLDDSAPDVTSGKAAIMWHFEHRSADYFSPDAFLRADAGLQVVRPFSRQRFAGDRQRRLTLSYLLGTDNDGVLYQHPYADVWLALGQSWLIRARAEMIEARTYQERSWSITLAWGGDANTAPR
jgi:hypothetical protein